MCELIFMASESEKKYGIVEDDSVKEFHRSRRMFCIYEGRLCIAQANLPYSHYTWFEKEGWVTAENDSAMDDVIRGMVDERGDVYFYKGYDFGVDSEVESTFFSHLSELVGGLNLKPDAKIFGGMIKQSEGKKWLPKKSFGNIGSRL